MTERAAIFRRGFVRRIDAGSHFEVFFVTAVSTILIVRFFLFLTGYPQLGGGKLHVAHMLWGGLAMLIALILLFALQGRFFSWLAAVAGGIGFGLFIDELGKFITSDNDYFFQPTIALIYLIFVGLYFLFRSLGTIANPSPQTSLVNAFDFAKEAVLRDLDQRERADALGLLARCDQADPTVVAMRNLLDQVQVVEAPEPHAAVRLERHLSRFYGRLIDRRWFKLGMVGLFVTISLVGLVAAVLGAESLATLGRVQSIGDVPTPTFVELGQLISALATGALVAVGVLRLRRSRVSAYRWFERALLVSIFIGQFFSFYVDELAAMSGLVFLLIVLGIVRFIIAEEQRANAVSGA